MLHLNCFQLQLPYLMIIHSRSILDIGIFSIFRYFNQLCNFDAEYECINTQICTPATRICACLTDCGFRRDRRSSVWEKGKVEEIKLTVVTSMLS